MSREKFKAYTTKAYLSEVVEEISMKYPQYSRLTYMKKDLVLRKFHLICNLMNTIRINESTKLELSGIKRKQDSDSGSMIYPLSKKVRREEIAADIAALVQPGALEDAMEEGEIDEPEEEEIYYNPVSPDAWLVADEDSSDYTIHVMKEEPNEETDFRFFCPLLLGVSTASLSLQLKQYGLVIDEAFPLFLVDIVDREKAKIIFISETGMESTIAHLRTQHGDFMQNHQIGVVTVNYRDGTCILENCDGLNVDAAINFMAHRRKILAENYAELDIPDIEECNVISSYVQMKREDWSRDIEEAADEMERLTVDAAKLNMPPTFPLVSLDDIIDNLEDIFETRKDLTEACWNGKNLPITCTHPIEIETDMTDTQIIKDYFPYGEYEVVHDIGNDRDDLLAFFSLMCKVLPKDTAKSTCVFKVEKTTKKTSLNVGVPLQELVDGLRCIGWDKKGKKVDNDTPGMQQKEYKKMENKAYPTWMKDVYLRECEDSGYVSLDTIEFDESPPLHPVDRVSVKCCQAMKDIFTKMNLALTTSIYMNLCSRIGGAYLINITSKNKMYSSVAAMPLIANVRKGTVPVKIVTGFVFRGPHHVRDSTDKIGTVTLERVGDNPLELYKKGVLLRICGQLWFLSKNAMSRAAPTYGSYLHNLLFIPTNFVGDMIMNVFSDIHEMQADCTTLISSNEDFLKHRLVEMGIMGLVGGSQEEGYFAGYRMLYMILLELSRGKPTALIEKEGFFSSINECALSNCYVLFMHGNLLFTLRHIADNRNVTKNAFVI